MSKGLYSLYMSVEYFRKAIESVAPACFKSKVQSNF